MLLNVNEVLGPVPAEVPSDVQVVVVVVGVIRSASLSTQFMKSGFCCVVVLESQLPTRTPRPVHLVDGGVCPVVVTAVEV
jgi:hypothetical protein